jgi:aldehyde:ferredoxin oxidoreductase
MHDPKYVPGMLVCGLLDATPGRHTQGSEWYPPMDVDLGAPESEWHKYADPTIAAKRAWAANMIHVVNAAGLCEFGYLCFPLQCIPDFIRACTGWDVDLEELSTTGERIANMRHAFNLREGLNPLDCEIPGRFVGKPPLLTGKVAGITLDTQAMLTEWLKCMDWDTRTARPSRNKLIELGLEDLVPDICG